MKTIQKLISEVEKLTTFRGHRLSATLAWLNRNGYKTEVLKLI